MTISIIIISYNVKYFLEQCLCSVTAATSEFEVEIIVIDNASTDNSITYLKPLFPQVIFIQNKTNEGFAKANNRALEQASGNYTLFLNPDTILAEDTLIQCLSFFQKTPNAGAVGVRMIDGSGTFLPESKRSFPSPKVSFYKLAGLSGLFPKSKRFGRYALGNLDEKEVHEIDVVAGAFMMIPKETLDETGGFDEQFFMYAEDIDLSYRIQKKGYQNYYLGNVTIVHFKGESTKKGSLNYVKVFYNAMNVFVKKWYNGGSAWLLRQGLQLGIVVRGLVSIVALPFQKKKTKQPVYFEKILLLGSKKETVQAKEIVANSYPEKSIIDQQNISELGYFFRGQMIVFCISELSYKRTIELLQQTTANSYKWFGKNSNCIVGSVNKNSTGEVIIGK